MFCGKATGIGLKSSTSLALACSSLENGWQERRSGVARSVVKSLGWACRRVCESFGVWRWRPRFTLQEMLNQNIFWDYLGLIGLWRALKSVTIFFELPWLGVWVICLIMKPGSVREGSFTKEPEEPCLEPRHTQTCFSTPTSRLIRFDSSELGISCSRGMNNWLTEKEGLGFGGALRNLRAVCFGLLSTSFMALFLFVGHLILDTYLVT